MRVVMTKPTIPTRQNTSSASAGSTPSPKDQAFHEVGLLEQQNSVCKPTAQKWRHTIERLKNKFAQWNREEKSPFTSALSTSLSLVALSKQSLDLVSRFLLVLRIDVRFHGSTRSNQGSEVI